MKSPQSLPTDDASSDEALRQKMAHDEALAKKGLPGLLRRRLIGAPLYAWRGLRACFRSEEAFRLQLMAAAVMVPLALLLDISPVEQVLLILPIALVLIVELLNTAIETVVNRVGSEFHELSGKAKDVASSAVLISLLTVVGVWALVLTPHVQLWLGYRVP